ncbi:universal stress protein [Streptomyces boncukensis]|uniref:Universal stress protein n=1 Tax=Streptomyces boncukensis TaxID=2711219 RepID=A0A6G4WXL4_9ACTN|nr:universal stress protein [Streptomyces boncukensis]NGO69191.1 universal stress protein [Streptomyces boncukensis]
MTPSQSVSQPRVLAGFDGSTPAWRALERAAEEAELRSVPLEILLGRPWDRTGPPESADQGALFESAHAMVERAAGQLRERHPGLELTASVSSQPAGSELLRRGRRAALTVVGNRGRGDIAGLLLGSVSMAVAAHAERPLLVVREDAEARHGRVLMGLKSEADQEALGYAFEEAARRGAELLVLRAWRFSTYPTTVPDEQTAAAVARFAVREEREKHPEVTVRTEAVLGDEARRLAEASAEADVLVIAAHRNRHRFGPRLGPVTHAVLHHARCPVAVVPAE